MGVEAATTRDGINGEGSSGSRKRPGSAVRNEGGRPRILENGVGAAAQGNEPSPFGANLTLWGRSKRYNEAGETFDSQIILELGEVPGTADAIRSLELQHPDKPTLWFRLNGQGYAPVLGDPALMNGYARILVLGVAGAEGTLGGYTPAQVENKISEFRGWLRGRYHYGSYGLKGSIYEDYLSTVSNWNSRHPAYPVTGMGGDGKRDPDFWHKVKERLRDSNGTRAEKVRALSQMDLRIDLRGLTFFNMPGSVATELERVDGALIADILHRQSEGTHEPVVTRVIEPMAGSGAYSNWARAQGFKGKVILNDINPLIAVTQSEVVSRPQGVTRGIQEIKSDLLAISRQHGFDFDDDLSMGFERAFPDDVSLTDKKKERIRRAEKFKAFVRGERAENLRQAVKDYFEESLAELISLKDGRMVIDEPAVTTSDHLTARTRVAALFYVMQNAANYSDTVSINLVHSAEYKLHLPLALLMAEKHYKVYLLPLFTNERKLFFISRLHGGNLDTTEFLNGDGWELFARADVGPRDLILLSGHFSDSYLNVEEFYEKVDRYVTRAVEKGAQVLIINDFSEAKAQGFRQRGFQVSRHARLNNDKRSYLLALRNVVAASGTPEALNNSLLDFVATMHDIEKRVGFIPGKVSVAWNDADYYDPEAVQRANVEQWAVSAADDDDRDPLSQDDSVLNRDEVGEWDRPALAASNEGENASRFDYQLIIQLEDNRTVSQAAIDLAGKHPSTSLLLLLDVAGQLRFAQGQDAVLARIGQLNRQGKNHWRLQAVGHGRDDAAGQRTLAGYLPSELAQSLKPLLEHPLLSGRVQARTVAPEHISLVGCALVDNEPTETSSYLQAFVHALDREKLSVRSVAAHSAKIIVNPQGGKRGVTLTDTKMVLRRSGDAWMALVWPGKTGYDESLLLTRTVGEELARLELKKQRLGVVTRAQAFQQGMEQLYRDNNLSAGEWLPLWHSLRHQEADKGGEYRLEFAHVAQADVPTRVLRLADRRVVEFMEDYNRQLTKVAQAREVQGEHLAGQSGEPEGEAPDGLNALFVVQTLFAWFSHKSRTEASGGELTGVLGCSLQVHAWLNTAQIIHGTVMEVAKVVHLFRSALAISKGKAFFSEARSLNVMSSLSKLNAGVGLFLNLGSVVLDVIELSQAQNEAQRAVYATQLAFDSAGLALGVFSLGASMAADAGIVGAATASGFAGALAAPVAGLGIGFTALAQAFSAVAEEAAQVGSYFAGLDAAYRQGGYRRVERKNSADHGADAQAPGHVLMESIPGAVISILDLRRQQLTLGSQYLYRNDPTGSTGSGKSNYFLWWPGHGANLDKNQAINIREGIGYRQAQVSFAPGDAILVLPMTAKSYLNYEYMILPFATARNDHGFDVLRRLEEDYRFDFDFYAFPGERIVRRIMPEYVETPVRVLLDARDRDILVPALPDILRGKLSYQLEGEGGHYRLSLLDGVSISLGGTADSRWTLDARQLKEATIRLNGNQLQVGSLAITLAQNCGEISLIDASGELFSVDREGQQLTLLEADGSGFTDWQALHAHLKQLTGHSPHGQPFVTVDHYRPAGRDTGRAFYQASQDRFIYTDYPQASEFLGQAQLGGIVEDKAWFHQGADVWQVAIATGQVLVQYRPRTFGGTLAHSRLVQRDGQLLLAIEERLPDCSVEHIYRVEEASLKLLAIHRVGQLFKPDENSLALLSAAAYWRDPLQRMTERQVSATLAQVVTCTASQGQTTERQWLVFNREYLPPRVVRANLGAAIPQDLSLVGSTAGDKPGFYFYDPHERRVYFQADEGMSGTLATAVALSEVSAVRGGDQSPWLALTTEGTLWLLDRGTVRLAGVLASWLSSHREHLTGALGRLASATPERLDNLVLWGLGGLAGKTTGAWYDCSAQRLVQGGGNLDGRHALTYLGLTADDRHAWILDGESRQLYRQALLPAETELTFSEQLLASPAAPDALVWPAPQQWVRGQRQGNRLHLESSDGVMVLLPVAATLTERAVLIALRIKAHQEIAQVGERIAALREHYDLPSAVRLLTEPGQAPGWYLPDSAQLLCAQGPLADHQLTYLGKAAGQTGGYIHDEDNGQLWCLDNLQSTPVGRYSFVHLSDGNLILQLDDSRPTDTERLPVLEEADCLMVSGRSGRVHHYPLDRALLSHYRQIIIDEQSRDAVIRADSERLVLQRGGEDLMLYDNDAQTSLLIPDIEQAAQRGTKLQLAPQALSGVLAGLSRP